MSKKSRLIVLCSAVLCSQYLCAQSRTMGIEEMFRLADENSKSIQAFRTGKEVADENLKTAKAHEDVGRHQRVAFGQLLGKRKAVGP